MVFDNYVGDGYGIPTTGLRFFTVYGPWGRPDMAPMIFANSILKDLPIKVNNYGQMSRDFTYVDDVIECMLGLIEKPAKPNLSFNNFSPESVITAYKFSALSPKTQVLFQAHGNSLESCGFY